MSTSPDSITSALPKFIERENVGELSVLPPGVFTGAGTMVYSASGDKATMQNFAAQYFDVPTGGKVTAHLLSSQALFVFFNVDRLSSPAQPMGWTPNHEFSLVIPVVLKFKNNPLKTRLGLWAPYVVIDNARGMVTGRESWGWFKGYGAVKSARNPATDGLDASMATMIFETLDANTEGQVKELVRVQAKPGTAVESMIEKVERAADDTGHLCKKFLELLADGIEDLPLFWDLVKMWKTHEIPAFNLKQFRATEDGTKACYQAITTCPLKVTAIRSMSLIKAGLDISITPCQSHEIVRQLGFPGNHFRSGIGLYGDMDYEAENGEVLWQAS